MDLNATPGGDGSEADPFPDLNTALAAVDATGQDIYLVGGTHDYTANKTINVANGLTIQSAPGTLATLRMTGSASGYSKLLLLSDNVQLRSLRTTTNAAHRVYDEGEAIYPPGYLIELVGRASTSGVFVNCDVEDAISVWSFQSYSGAGDQVVMRASTVRNFGYVLGAGGGGEGLYGQNKLADRRKVVKQTIFALHFDVAVQIYTAGSAEVKNFLFQDVISVGLDRFYMWPGVSTDELHMERLYTWGDAPHLGNIFGGAQHGTASLTDSYVVLRNDVPIYWGTFAAFDFTGTTIVNLGASPLIRHFVGTNPGDKIFGGNTYYDPNAVGFQLDGVTVDWATWQLATGDDGTYTVGLPDTNVAFTIPTPDAGDRVGHIVVYNWQQLETVTVDVTALSLSNGADYRLENAYDPADFTDFTHDGSSTIAITMTGRSVALPVGHEAALDTIDLRFGAWILRAL